MITAIALFLLSHKKQIEIINEGTSTEIYMSIMGLINLSALIICMFYDIAIINLLWHWGGVGR